MTSDLEECHPFGIRSKCTTCRFDVAGSISLIFILAQKVYLLSDATTLTYDLLSSYHGRHLYQVV
jgi:hypothetical protein